MTTLDVGREGEQLAAEFLRKKGYKILEYNWRFGKDEIDIIAKDQDTLVIVEVKSRKASPYSDPLAAVNKAKQSFLIRATEAYIQRTNSQSETRFDVMSIIFTQNHPIIEHIIEAFHPSW